MRILAALCDESLLPWLQWRVSNPFEYINGYDGIKATFEYVFVGMPIPKDVNIFVLPRIIITKEQRKGFLKWQDRCRQRNPDMKWVYETDDDIFSESFVQQCSKIFLKDDMDVRMKIAGLDELEARRHNALWTMQQCDAVTVSAKSLGVYVKSLVPDKEVYVVPNAIDDKKFVSGLDKIRRRPSSNVITVGWAGGRRNFSDIELMVEGWKKVAKEHRDKVQFVVAGWIPEQIEKDPDISRNLRTQSWLPTNKYAKGLQVDIGCVSVDGSPFSIRKSVIKAWEFSLAGAAVIGSDNLYSEEPIILLARDEKDWYQTITYFIEDTHARESLGQAYRTHVNLHHLLKHEFHVWIDAYRRILGAVD